MDQPDTMPTEAVTFTDAEIASTEEARADYKLRGGVPFAKVTAWLDSLDTDEPLPRPEPRKA